MQHDVVYLLIPTSNHNLGNAKERRRQVVYLLIPTSNHNELARLKLSYTLYIFWFLHQTTTVFFIEQFKAQLYIFWFLHQTTTAKIFSNINFSCISFDSYIKPQLQRSLSSLLLVVYLLIPTSSHNILRKAHVPDELYIFWFLHQTTTAVNVFLVKIRCISFDSYIKPQLSVSNQLQNLVVYLLIPTSNHNW